VAEREDKANNENSPATACHQYPAHQPGWAILKRQPPMCPGRNFHDWDQAILGFDDKLLAAYSRLIAAEVWSGKNQQGRSPARWNIDIRLYSISRIADLRDCRGCELLAGARVNRRD
jgi:hypothetical protein